MKVNDFSRIVVDLRSLADSLADLGFIGDDSNQDPCFTDGEDGFERCIYDDDGHLLWGYTITMESNDAGEIELSISILDSQFSYVSDAMKSFCFDLDSELEDIKKQIESSLDVQSRLVQK